MDYTNPYKRYKILTRVMFIGLFPWIYNACLQLSESIYYLILKNYEMILSFLVSYI